MSFNLWFLRIPIKDCKFSIYNHLYRENFNWLFTPILIIIIINRNDLWSIATLERLKIRLYYIWIFAMTDI